VLIIIKDQLDSFEISFKKFETFFLPNILPDNFAKILIIMVFLDRNLPLFLTSCSKYMTKF